MKKRIFYLSIFCFLFFSLKIFSQDLFEERLGFEDSEGLRQELAQNFFDEDLNLNLEKIQRLRNINQKRKTEIFNLIVQNEINEGHQLEIAKERALKDTRVQVADVLDNWFDHLIKETDPLRRDFLIKNILRISSAYISSGSLPPVPQAIGAITTLIGENYKIPINDLKRPMPSNLGNKEEGRYFKKDELEELVKKGFDISLIDPPNNPYWKKPKESIGEINPLYELELEKKIPNVFNFKSVKKSDTKAKFKVVEILPNGKKVTWKLKLGREVNSEYVSSRIFDLVGFYTDRYYYVKSPKVYFKDEEHWRSTVQEWISFYDTEDQIPSNFVKEQGIDERGYYVVFFEGLLESLPENVKRVGPFHLSYMGNWDRREVRAQLLLNAFIANFDFKEDRNNKIKLIEDPKNSGNYQIQELTHDLGYSFGSPLTMNQPNGYKWSFLKKKGNNVIVDFERFVPMEKDKNPYLVVTYSDLKWIARYLVQISRGQLKTICENSGWPKEVARLFLEKMVKRRNEVVKIFNLSGVLIDGRKIELWPEVNPKKFNLGDAIVKGELVKSFKEQGSINYLEFEYDLFNFGGPLINTALTQVFRLVSSVPFYRMLTFPGGSNSFGVNKKFIGAGIGIRFNRDIIRNTDLKDENKAWVITDKLEFYGIIGGEVGVPITGGFAAEFGARGILGKEFVLVHHSSNLRSAAKDNLKRIFSLPFKKKETLNSLQLGESIGQGHFVGFETEQELTVGPEPLRLIKAGIGLAQRKKYLNLTKVEKISPFKYEVTKAKADELSLTFKSFFELFHFLEIRFFEAGIMLGKSHAKTFYFDFENNKGLEYHQAFHQSIFSQKTDKAEILTPSSITDEKYVEKMWRLSFMASLGTNSREVFGVTVMPDDSIKRYFKYHSLHERWNFFKFKNEKHHVWAEMEFEDENFEKVSSRKLYVQYDVKDQQTTPKNMDRRVQGINTMVAQDDFLKFDAGLFTDSHLGTTDTNLLINFSQGALKCILEAIGCVEKGEKAQKIDWFFKNVIRKKSTPAKALKRLGDYVRRGIQNKLRMKSILEFVGPEKFDVDLLITSENLPSDDKIHILRHSAI